jgi:hypothetical protein
MARTKKDVLKEIEDAMNAACYRMVKTTTGQVCFVRPTPSGTSSTAVEYNKSHAPIHVANLLIEQDIEATHADIDSVLTTLQSKALDADPVRVHNRVAEALDGVIYLDLGDARKRVIEIRPDGWRESTKCPVLFNRPASMLPLPFPVGGQAIEHLRCVLRIEDDDVWWLALGFVLSCLKERAAHFVAVIEGPPGSGKSVLTRYLGWVLDHRNPQTPRIPLTRKDIMAVAANRYILAFDNLTPLTPQQSGDLCAIATGSGLEGRELYTHFGSSGADVQRPMILNGIQGLLVREEVRSRAVPILLPERTPESRRLDEDIEDAFRRHWPAILGALCDLAVAGLNYQEPVCEPSQRVRMLSSANWVERCLRGAGLGEGLFLGALDRARISAVRDVAGEWSLRPHLIQVAKANFEGTASDLFEVLVVARPVRNAPSDWPATPAQLGMMLRDRREELRQAGVEFTSEHVRAGTQYRFHFVGPASSTTPPTPQSSSPSTPVPVASKVDEKQADKPETRLDP